MNKWDSYPNWVVTEARPLLPHYSFNTLHYIAFAEIQGEVQVILIWNKLWVFSLNQSIPLIQTIFIKKQTNKILNV